MIRASLPPSGGPGPASGGGFVWVLEARRVPQLRRRFEGGWSLDGMGPPRALQGCRGPGTLLPHRHDRPSRDAGRDGQGHLLPMPGSRRMPRMGARHRRRTAASGVARRRRSGARCVGPGGAVSSPGTARPRPVVGVAGRPIRPGSTGKIADRTDLALRVARHADRPAVVDQHVGEAEPLLRRDHAHQVAFDLVGIVVLREPDPLRAGAARGYRRRSPRPGPSRAPSGRRCPGRCSPSCAPPREA